MMTTVAGFRQQGAALPSEDQGDDPHRGGVALGQDLVVGQHAGDAQVIEHVDDHHGDGPDNQGAGQGPLGVLQLRVDDRGDDPALVGERRGQRGLGQPAPAGHGLGGGGEVLHGQPVGQAGDRAHGGHQDQRDELDRGGGHLASVRPGPGRRS